MRLEITFVNNNEFYIPINYKLGIQSFIYSCLSNSLALKYHEHEKNYKNRIYKFFNFSNIIGSYHIENKCIKFLGKSKFYISSMDKDFIYEIYKSIYENKILVLYGKSFVIDDIKVIYEHFVDGVITYKCISPVTVYSTLNNKTIFYNPNDEIFKEKIIENIKRKYYAYFNEEYNLFINVYNFKKVKKGIFYYKNMSLEGYEFEVKINTTKKVHELIKNCGLGSKNSAGFGMIEEIKL